MRCKCLHHAARLRLELELEPKRIEATSRPKIEELNSPTSQQGKFGASCSSSGHQLAAFGREPESVHQSFALDVDLAARLDDESAAAAQNARRVLADVDLHGLAVRFHPGRGVDLGSRRGLVAKQGR